MCPSSQRRSGSWPFFWPCCLSPSPGDWSASPGRFHVLVFYAWEACLWLLVSGIAVRALLLATSLPIGVDVFLAPSRCLSVPTVYGLCIYPYGSCSEVPGPPILLSSYAARIISCGAGFLSSLLPFRGCLSGSSGLGWGSVELLRTSDVRVLHSSSWPRPRLGALVFPCYVFQCFSFRERGWVVLCFRHGLCDDVLWPLPCSSVCGLHCTGPTKARQSQWETVISCSGGQVFLVRLGGASSAM